MVEQYDFVAIGDTVIDAFIKLIDASVHCRMNHEDCEICMRFGDKIPYEEVYIVPAVGNSANAAVSAARLGLKSALVTNVGKDYYGEECLASLVKDGVATEFIKSHDGKKTNYHYVLWYEDDRTILIKHEEYLYEMPEVRSPRWLYLSSLGQHSTDFHERIEKYLADHPEVKLAFQPGTFQMKLGKEKLEGLYRRTEIFFCNKEEAQRILESEEEDIKKLLSTLAALGPKNVIITDGPAGAYAYTEGRAWFMPPYPDLKPPYERTGAGDAFSSTVTAAIALGYDLPTALTWGPVNSMSVVQKVGAQAGLLTRHELEEYLTKAPAEYRVKEL